MTGRAGDSSTKADRGTLEMSGLEPEADTCPIWSPGSQSWSITTSMTAISGYSVRYC